MNSGDKKCFYVYSPSQRQFVRINFKQPEGRHEEEELNKSTWTNASIHNE